MRTLLCILALVAISYTSVYADDPKPTAAPTKLKLGDPAPPIKPTKWLAGGEVALTPGKIYVVEFWATWCGPCVAMMPHLGDLQEELGPKGVQIIGFTSQGPNNTQEQVVKFLDKRGAKLGYSIAYADDHETYDAYMKAAGQAGIPCSYVIDKAGKIAYIGHPLFLEEVLPKLLAGTWDPIKGTAELEAADKLWDATYAVITKPGDPIKQLEQWEDFSAKWPRLASDPYMNAARLKLLIAAKRFPSARELAELMLSKALKRNDLVALGSVAEATSTTKDQPELSELGVKASEAGLGIDGETVTALIRAVKAYATAGNTAKLEQYGPKAIAAAEKAMTGEKDAMGCLRLAAAHHATGNKDKAKEIAEKAITIAASNNPGIKDYIAEQAKKYGAQIQGEKP